MMEDHVRIQEERLSAHAYIDFLKQTDLGSQYPKERFEERIAKLVDSVSLSLVARNENGLVIGVLFGLTDFAYWLFITDIGIDHFGAGGDIAALLIELSSEAGDLHRY